MLQHFHRPDKQASSMAAAMLVLVQAVTGVAFVVVLLVQSPDLVFLGIGGGVFAVALLLAWWLGRPNSVLRESMGWVFSRKARPERLDYQMSRKPVSFRRFGTNQPPTLDEVRDLKAGTTNNWVPSKTSGRVSSRR